MNTNWDLTLLYPSLDAWKKDFLSIDDDIKTIEAFRGKLNTEENFKACSSAQKNMEMKLEKVFNYAARLFDINQKDKTGAEVYSMMYSKYGELVARLSFVEPELLSIGEEKVKSWCNGIASARYHMIDAMFKSQKYTKSAKEEEIMATYNSALQNFNNLYDQLTNVDNHGTTLKMSNGDKIYVDESNFRKYLGESKYNAKDRKKIFESVFKFYSDYQHTLAGIYKGIMDGEYANAKTRGYKSILESHLAPKDIPTEVFLSLIKTTKQNTAPVKRYYELRKKYLGLSKHHTYDRFLSLAESNKEYSYADSKKMVLEADKFMGDDYVAKAKEAMAEGRVNVYPSEGKRSGAYSTHVYTNGTFILLNHNDSLDSAFTLAHESGHSIHSLYSIEGQPFETADYTIFVAEIASTFNEQVFLDYLMKNTTDKNEKIVLLQQSIDNILSTFYRQSLFADYEYQAHKLVEDKKPVTSDALCEIMTKLYKKYYGINLKSEKVKDCVWGYIPHFFHTPFYVYQYATSFAASMAFFEKIKNGESKAFENYINMLKSGGSDYPVNLVKNAGVDLTNPSSFMAVVNRLNELVDELENLLK